MKHHYCSPSFWQGVRRISALLVCMLFTFVFVVSPIKVKAEAFPIPPVWLPMNPYNAQGLEGNYVLLNDDQKEIVKEIIGAVNVVNLGFGQYVLMNPISGVSNTRQFLRDYGGTFLETFWSQIMGTSRAMTDFVGSTIYKASTYNTLAEYEADTAPSVASGSQKYFQISPELTVAFKNWYRANGGVEDWQYQTVPFKSHFTYPTAIVPATSTYYTYLNQLSQPHVRSDLYSINSVNLVMNHPLFDYHNLFLNTQNGTFYFVNDVGTVAPAMRQQRADYVSAKSSDYSGQKSFVILHYDGPNYYNIPLANTYVEAVRMIYDMAFITWGSSQYIHLALEDFVNHVYVGADWSSKNEIFNIDDLNIGSSSSEYIDNISDTGYVDINTLIGQIADEVVNLREVVEESVLVKDNSEAIPYVESLTQAIDKYLSEPESQVVIPVDIFSGLTGPSGPISYLWFMTKPLVSYTADMLSLLTYDSDGQFQFTGLGYIVVGIVSIGIIGGLVTKCLL